MSVLYDYILFVEFDDGYKVLYDVKDDIKTLPSFRALVDVYGLFKQAQLDKPNLCILERQDRFSQRQYLCVWKGCIIKVPPWFAVQMGSVVGTVAVKVCIFFETANFLRINFCKVPCF